MPFEILTTKNIGFCFGVKRAVGELQSALETETRPVYTFGPIIHNDLLNAELAQKGVHVTEDPEDIPQGSLVFVRTHGVGKDTLEKLALRGAEIRDMTCPKVKRIHAIVSESENVIIVGDPRHPEVQGIVGNTKKNYRLCPDMDALDALMPTLDPATDYTVVEQTTYNAPLFAKMKQKLLGVPNVHVVDTICTSTQERQKEVEDLAQRVDAMVIIGGKDSSNTRKLYELASKHCVSFLIGDASQLPKDLHTYKKIGLTAGASTTGGAIEEVINTMENENKTIGTEEEFDFAAAVDASMKIIRNGQRVTGTVTEINGTEIQIDLGAKHSGFIPAEEFANDENPVKVGDEVEAFVVKVNDVEGIAQLSKAKLDQEKGFEKIQALRESGEICTGKVSQVVKGGLVVLLNKVRVFIPASHVDLRKNVNLEDYADKEVRFKVIEVELKGRNSRVIGSIRNVLREERGEKAKALWEGLEVGKKYTGVVKSLTDFGAFVDIGGGDGLVHITDLAWGKIKHPSEVVKEGEVVEVEVKAFDPETKKISLVYKKEEDNPWLIFRARYAVGDVADVKVLKLMPYGAFVGIIDGVDGLVHISQLAHKRVEKAADVLTVGQQVQAKIIAIDDDNKKVSLSIKELLPEEEETTEEAPADEQ